MSSHCWGLSSNEFTLLEAALLLGLQHEGLQTAKSQRPSFNKNGQSCAAAAADSLATLIARAVTQGSALQSICLSLYHILENKQEVQCRAYAYHCIIFLKTNKQKGDSSANQS